MNASATKGSEGRAPVVEEPLHARVIVGVDGSEPSRVALAWAFTTAERMGAELVVLHAWQFSPISVLAGGPVDVEEYRAAAQRLVDDLATEVLGADAAVRVIRKAVEAPPVSALIEEAGPDDILVLGSRGAGGFRGLLLGSVSTQVAHHAPCPVVVVPPPTRFGTVPSWLSRFDLWRDRGHLHDDVDEREGEESRGQGQDSQ